MNILIMYPRLLLTVVQLTKKQQPGKIEKVNSKVKLIFFKKNKETQL